MDCMKLTWCRRCNSCRCCCWRLNRRCLRNHWCWIYSWRWNGCCIRNHLLGWWDVILKYWFDGWFDWFTDCWLNGGCCVWWCRYYWQRLWCTWHLWSDWGWCCTCVRWICSCLRLPPWAYTIHLCRRYTNTILNNFVVETLPFYWTLWATTTNSIQMWNRKRTHKILQVFGTKLIWACLFLWMLPYLRRLWSFDVSNAVVDGDSSTEASGFAGLGWSIIWTNYF